MGLSAPGRFAAGRLPRLAQCARCDAWRGAGPCSPIRPCLRPQRSLRAVGCYLQATGQPDDDGREAGIAFSRKVSAFQR